MKKTTLSLLFFIIISSGFYAQAQKGWSLGAKAGLNISSAGGDYSESDSRLGYNFGIIADYNYSNHVFLRTGLEFTSKGAKYKYDWNDIASDGTFGFKKRHFLLNYLQLPISIGYRFAASENLNMTLNAGGYLAYGVFAREKYTSANWCGTPGSTPYYSGTNKGFDDCHMRAFDAGLLGGIGFEYKQYMLLINYDLGLFNTMTGMYDGGEPSWKNRNWSFSLGYKF